MEVSFSDDAGNEEALAGAPTAIVVGAAVWESELTVGRGTDIIPVFSGYSIYGDLGGTLSSDRFAIDGTTYRIKFLLHAANSLWLSMNQELPMDFTLQIGDFTYLASTSMVPGAQNGVGMYWWSSATPDWSAGDSVQASLIIHPEVALGSRQRAPVTGYFGTLPAEHDGNEDVSFRIHFSESVAITAANLRSHVLSVSGGVVSNVTAVGSATKIWEVSVTPESTDAIRIEIEADQECGLSGAVCAADGRRLFNPMKLVVPGRQIAVNESTPEPENSPATGAPSISGTAQVDSTLTVSLEDNPASHNGTDEFTFELRFSEAPKLSYRTLKNHSFTVDGGTVNRAERITRGSNTRWRITVAPDRDGPVIITLPVTEECGAEGAICTKDGRRLSNRVELIVSGTGE